MNPVLKKILRPTIARHQIADLVEKHVGADSSAVRCEEALSALKRIRDDESRIVMLTLIELGDFGDSACHRVRNIVTWLRALKR
jgi:hypothetical protein